jgi:large subunit ribosomal protein L22
MDVTAVHKYARIAPSKARSVARMLKGLPAAQALAVAGFSGKKAGGLILKVLKSAVANAQQNHKLPVDGLRVKDARIDEGARGSASPILKRTCHIKVVLTDGKE